MELSEMMKAVVIDGYGEPDVLRVVDLPVPRPAAGEVLVEIAAAGVGVWDAGERSGAMAGMLPDAAKHFPRVIGGDGSGRIVALGDGVTGFAVGDEVYGYAFGSPGGGFYAEYIALPAGQVAPRPDSIDLVSAAVLAIPGVTALRGVDDTLGVTAGQRLAIFGASGGVGYPALQLAKAMGASVLAVVSGADGAALANDAGADAVVDSRSGNVGEAVAAFAPDGLDAVLAVANGAGLEALAAALKPGGTLAFPHGVQPEPTVPEGRNAEVYEGNADRATFDKLNALIERRPFDVHVAGRLPLEAAAEAHRRLKGHHLGRMVLQVAGR
ncbi:MAG: NADP-dependent oxidoreductase [Janthinobacterium lividum]